MAQEKFRCTSWWFLSLQITLYLFLIFVQGSEDADEAYRNGRSLVLEYFLPINLPAAAVAPTGREKRDTVEGSGEEEEAPFGEVDPGTGDPEEADNSTQNAFARLILEGGATSLGNSTESEGSGEAEEEEEQQGEEGGRETSTEERTAASEVPEIADVDESATATATESDESEEVVTGTTLESRPTAEEETVSTEMIFDRSEDFEEMKEETATTTENVHVEMTRFPVEDATDAEPTETTQSDVESTTAVSESETTATDAEPTPTTAEPERSTLPSTDAAATIPVDVVGETVPDDVTTPTLPATKMTPPATEGLPAGEAVPVPTTRQPAAEEVFKETKVAHDALEALPGNILQRENLSLGADPLLVANTRLMDSEETVQASSAEPKRLGAYIVIGLILLSFSTLVGYITFRKRMDRKRQEFESHQESLDAEKALLGLTDYKDNPEQEENHLKNNEKAAIVKSNSQINRFEKNTNFASPKNLNTIANEKNIEKDNVLKSTAENLTQVIIEDSPKEVEEEKNVPGMEKLIVKTRIDQDSIPKKPIIVNRSSTGYLPIPQENS